MKTNKVGAKTITELLETANKAAIARKIGVQASTVARWANGTAIPSGDKLQALARELRISSDLIILSGEAA